MADGNLRTPVVASPRDLPSYLTGKATVDAWMRGWVKPDRAEQDRLAEAIRRTRVAAREAVALAGGEVLAAYVAALRATLIPGHDAPSARELRGNQNRRGAGPRTREALVLLGAGQARAAAEVDLDADPSCDALDQAREALRAARQARGEDHPTAAERRAESTLAAFEATVQAACLALRGGVVQVLRLAQLGEALEGPFGGDALVGGWEGMRKAFRVYRPGPKCLGSFARQGWIVAGAIRALRGVWAGLSAPGPTFSLDWTAENNDAHEIERGNNGQTIHGKAAHTTLAGDEGPEEVALKVQRAQALADVVSRLSGPDREVADAYLSGRRVAPLPSRVMALLRSLIADVGPGEVLA